MKRCKPCHDRPIVYTRRTVPQSKLQTRGPTQFIGLTALAHCTLIAIHFLIDASVISTCIPMLNTYMYGWISDQILVLHLERTCCISLKRYTFYPQFFIIIFYSPPRPGKHERRIGLTVRYKYTSTDSFTK